MAARVPLARTVAAAAAGALVAGAAAWLLRGAGWTPATAWLAAGLALGLVVLVAAATVVTTRWFRCAAVLVGGLVLGGLAALCFSRPAFAWMTWTAPTAWGFAALYLLLVILTAIDLVRPTVERKGFLPMPTTRGDRVFIGIVVLVGATFAWLALGPGPSYLWVALPVACCSLITLRWG